MAQFHYQENLHTMPGFKGNKKDKTVKRNSTKPSRVKVKLQELESVLSFRKACMKKQMMILYFPHLFASFHPERKLKGKNTSYLSWTAREVEGAEVSFHKYLKFQKVVVLTGLTSVQINK